MARVGRSSTVFFRYDGDDRKDVYLRIAPTAIRFQQSNKGSVTNTLGGYFREIMSSKDPQYQGLQLPDLTIEAQTGIGYRNELKQIDWIWRHHADLKKDGVPVDLYFFDMAEVGDFQGVVRDAPRAFLIEIMQFAWDDTVSAPYDLKFTMRCKVLRDLYWDLENPSDGELLEQLDGNSEEPTAVNRYGLNRFRNLIERGEVWQVVSDTARASQQQRSDAPPSDRDVSAPPTNP